VRILEGSTPKCLWRLNQAQLISPDGLDHHPVADTLDRIGACNHRYHPVNGGSTVEEARHHPLEETKGGERAGSVVADDNVGVLGEDLQASAYGLLASVTSDRQDRSGPRVL
jgi:hypothetical protein